MTVEPCTMCGSAGDGRVGRLVFGAWEPKTGAAVRCGTWFGTGVDASSAGARRVLAEDCAALLDDFFARHRDLGSFGPDRKIPPGGVRAA